MCSHNAPLALAHAACLAALAAGAAAPAAAGAQTVTGRVLDRATSEPLTAVEVALLDSAGARLRAVETDAQGRFELPIADPGSYTVRAERLGWARATSQPFTIEGDPILEIEFQLAAAAIRLPPVAVRTRARSARLAEVGFYERRDMGIGRYLDAEEIAARGTLITVTDLLRLEPSVQHLWDGASSRFVVIFRGGARRSFSTTMPCFPLLVLDGTRTDSRYMDDLVHPLDIAAMELYPSGNGAPVRYAGLGAPCGIIVIWTKR